MPKHFSGRTKVPPTEPGLSIISTMNAKSYWDFLADTTAIKLNAANAGLAGLSGSVNRILEAAHPTSHACTVSADTTYGGWKITTHGSHDNDYGVLHPCIYGEAPLSNANVCAFWSIGAGSLGRYDINVTAGGLNTWKTATAVTTPATRVLTMFYRLYVHQTAGCEIFCGLYSGPSTLILPATDAASYVGSAYNGCRCMLVEYNSDIGGDWRTILNNSGTAVTAATSTKLGVEAGRHEVIFQVDSHLKASVVLNGNRLYLGTVEADRYWLPVVGIKNNGTAGTTSLTVMEMKGLKQ